MSASTTIERARVALARSQGRRAVRLGWRAASQAMREGNAPALSAIADLADEAAGATEGRVRGDALRLAHYCRAVLDGAGGGLRASHALEALFTRRSAAASTSPRTRCPWCAEDIAVGARVCKHCDRTLDPE